MGDTPQIQAFEFRVIVTTDIVIPDDYDSQEPIVLGRGLRWPTAAVMSGQRFLVDICGHQVDRGATATSTTEERMRFSQSDGGVLLGALGLQLASAQRLSKFPRDYGYSALDRLDNLPFFFGYHRVPYFHLRPEGDFSWYMGNFEGVWYDDNRFLRFRPG